MCSRTTATSEAVKNSVVKTMNEDLGVGRRRSKKCRGRVGLHYRHQSSQDLHDIHKGLETEWRLEDPKCRRSEQERAAQVLTAGFSAQDVFDGMINLFTG